ncbi:MAG: nitroreductase [Pseudomonadota bacterium]
MSAFFPNPPPAGVEIDRPLGDPAVRRFLASRRSAGKNLLGTPGPSPEQIDEILQVSMRAPDHRRVEPWRFLVFEGQARLDYGALLAALKAEDTDASEDDIQAEHARLLRAPVVVALISSPQPEHKTPVWEQELSAGAVAMNLLHAAHAAGWGAVWLSEWICYDARINEAMSLSPTERLVGFFYIGTPQAASVERPRPDAKGKIKRWSRAT